MASRVLLAGAAAAALVGASMMGLASAAELGGGGGGHRWGNWSGDGWNGHRWHGNHVRDHRHFRGGFFAFGYPYHDYGYAYNDCYHANWYSRYDWRWPRYCGPYLYSLGYGPFTSDYSW